MYYLNSNNSFPRYSDEQIDFIVNCMETMINEEIAELFAEQFHDYNITPRRISYLIDYLHLEKYITPPDKDRPWEEIKQNKIQCYICGRWYKTLSQQHLKLKHKMTIVDYKEKYGVNKTQSLCSLNTAEKFRKIAENNIKKGLFKSNLNFNMVRPHSYKKSRQCVTIRTESGLQSKAAKAKKKPATFRTDKRVKILINELRKQNISFKNIAKELENQLNYKISEITVMRLFYGKRI